MDELVERVDDRELTEPELRSALTEWPFTPDSHEVFGRYVAFVAEES
ncbi:hypothetical protein [Streptomyces sp. NPDC059783]